MKKNTLLITLALAIPALGGTTAYVAPETSPAPAPSLMQWFVGGSYGQFDLDGSSTYDGSDITLGDVADIDLDEIYAWQDSDYDGDTGDDTFEDFVNGYNEENETNYGEDDLLGDTIFEVDEEFADQLSFRTDIDDVELDMYSFHLGRSLGDAGGFNMAAYLEVAWLTGDFTATGILTNIPEATQLILFSESFDVDIVPVTLNFKAEHNLFGPVGGYLSAGLGYAFTRIDGGGYDETGGGFYAQGAAGLVWYATESIDIYGGARWVYLSSLDYGDDDLGFELDDQIGWEIGARYKF